MIEIAENKSKIRAEYRQRRDVFVRNLDNASKSLSFRRPPSPLAQLIEQSKVIAIYHAVGSEAPTDRLIEYLSDIDTRLALPKVNQSGQLEFRHVTNLQLLEAGFKNIPEPSDQCELAEPDLIIAPLVAFDRKLRRLGQGGGHYDRSFAQFPAAKRVGLAWSMQEADDIPVESHDLPLHMIVTEREIIE